MTVARRLAFPIVLSVAALLGATSAQGVPAAGPGYVAGFQIAYDSPPFPDTRYRVTVSFAGDVCGNPFDNTWGFEATRTGGPSTPPPTLAPVTFAVVNPVTVTGDRWIDESGAEIARIDFNLRFNAGGTPTLTPSWHATGDIVNVVATPTVVPISARTIAECPAAQPPPPPPPPPLSTPSGTATGTVLVNGKRYASGRPLPYGSKVNVTDGRLTLKTRLGTVTVYGNGVTAVFRLVRLREPSDMVDLRLVEGRFNGCGKNNSAKPVRRLWARGSGKFQTKGRYATASTARGAWWLTEDSCSTTRIRVRQGSVTVRDLTKAKTTILGAPKTYVAGKPAR
jgi:hypothetical protein